MSKHISVAIEEELYRRLRIRVAELGTTIREYLIGSIEKRLNDEEGE